MLERNSYGEATVRVAYAVYPLDDAGFDADHTSRVKMRYLPQAGLQVSVRYDPEKHEVLEVLTAPGEEEGTALGSQPTEEIPWVDERSRVWRGR